MRDELGSAREVRLTYPEGEALKGQVKKRQRVGVVWAILFASALIIAIIVLTVLVFSIINDSFGVVAIQYEMDPETIVTDLQREYLTTAVNTATSENDQALADAIAEDPNGIGFFGYAFYQTNQDGLNLLSVDGVEPNAATAESGEYPLARPLYLYSTEKIMEENQAAQVFVNYYLTNVGAEIEDIGYFPVSSETLSASQVAWINASGYDIPAGQWATINPDGISGDIRIVGSSTVHPLTEQMLARYVEDGFVGSSVDQSVGSTAGLRALCVDGTADIANASRAIKPSEFEACRSNAQLPVEFRVGTDALAIVANPELSFLENVTQEELAQIFTTAVSWSDVNDAWPNEPIQRYIPGAESGTLDFFADTVVHVELEALPKDALIPIIAANVSTGRGRVLEREQRFYEDKLVFESPAVWNEVCAAPANERPSGCTGDVRTDESVYEVLKAEVLGVDVVQSWTLIDSIFRRSAIEAEALEKYPNADLELYSWISWDFLRTPQSSTPEFAGIRTAIMGSLWVVAITILFSFPVGVGAAIYLEEYASHENRINRIIQTNINNLAGVPSIIYGMLGLAIFVRAMEFLTSGSMFGIGDSASANGRTILSAGLTLGLLILPIIIIAAQEALRAVPGSLRQAGLALGATKWQTTWHHVLPSALPGILTGAILAVSRALGETAPLVVIGASTFIVTDPANPFSKFTTLPIQIYQWTSRPQDEFRNLAAAAIIILLIMLLLLNASAIYLRNRYSRRA